jgi:YHS domain-containing protein
MTKDPVCGTEVDERNSKAKGLTAEFGGQVRFFCSTQCRDMFKQNPTAHWQAKQQQPEEGGEDRAYQ